MEGLAKFELDGGNIEQNIDDPGRVQTMGEQQDIATAATEGKPGNTVRIGGRH